MENVKLTNEEIEAAIQTLFNTTDELKKKIDSVEVTAVAARQSVTSLKTKVDHLKLAPTNKWDVVNNVASNIGAAALGLGICGIFGFVVYACVKDDVQTKKEGQNEN